MQTIYLDISNKGVYPCIQAKQEEVGRKFLAVITDNGVPYNIPNNALLSVWYDGDSGSGNYSSIGENSAFEIDGNNIAVELVLQMLSVPGNGELCLTITHGDGREISSWNIPYCVEKKPGAGSSVPTEYYTALTEAGAYAAEQATIAKRYADQAVSATENKLDLTGGTMAGDIAMGGHKVTGLGTPITSGDAVPLGYALGAFLPAGTTAEQLGAAPAGFGLGKQNEAVISSLSELDNTWRNGWYKFQTFNEENIEGHKLGLLYVNSSTSSVEQIFVPYRNPSRLIRVNHAEDGWGVWEYENPPMVLGVEYRTTERFEGKPVYTMLNNVGSFPSVGAVSYYTIKNGVAKILRVKGTSANGGFPVPYISTDAYLTISGTVNGGAMTIIVYVEKGDLIADQCIAQVWYIKD